MTLLYYQFCTTKSKLRAFKNDVVYITECPGHFPFHSVFSTTKCSVFYDRKSFQKWFFFSKFLSKWRFYTTLFLSLKWQLYTTNAKKFKIQKKTTFKVLLMEFSKICTNYTCKSMVLVGSMPFCRNIWKSVRLSFDTQHLDPTKNPPAPQILQDFVRPQQLAPAPHTCCLS